LFESYYFRLIKDFDSIDIGAVAKNTATDSLRLVEALHVRLGNSKKYKNLTYWKAGICYVCRGRQNNPDSKEPICLDCLDAFFKSWADSKQDAVPKDVPLPVLNASNAKILIIQAHQQLDCYKSVFGQLAPQPVQRVVPFLIPSSDEEAALKHQKTEEALAIMDQPDSTLALSYDEWVAIEMELGLQEFMMMSVLKIKGFRR
jgi:hypothetical protein